MRRSTNEWEFQSQAVSWINEELSSRDYGFECATAEFPNSDGKRSDIIVWVTREPRKAVLEIEVKPPSVPLNNRAYQRDAVAKAQHVGAPYLALWNMRDTHLCRTPAAPRMDLLPDDFVDDLGSVPGVDRVSDWPHAGPLGGLKHRARELLACAHELVERGTVRRQVVEPTVFVDFLSGRVQGLRTWIRSDVLQGLAADRGLRTAINQWAIKQGLATFVDDLNAALGAQLAYRVLGQALFYHAFRRRERSLPDLVLDAEDDIQTQLRSFWNAVRAHDYEALYEESPLESIPLSPSTQREIANLVNDLAPYDWGHIRDDVLGSVFEHMIPEGERIALGQYYTPGHLADLIVSFCQAGEGQPMLDPAVGTGTFLMRAHDRLCQQGGITHQDALSILWGCDVSAFPAELAVINLCRLGLDEYNNFPRITVRDFFDLKPGMELQFPPAKRSTGSTVLVPVSVPVFHSVVGNPPYVRSQQLDDLDTAYKERLHRLARKASTSPDSKFDAYVYFILHALQFLGDGGYLGFVTSAAWLTASYGQHLQHFILSHFQPVAVVWSEVEPLFPAQDVDTVVVVLQKLGGELRKAPRGEMRFATLQRPLRDILGAQDAPGYWARTDLFVDELGGSGDGDHGNYRIRVVDAEAERRALGTQDGPRNWGRHLKITPVYSDIFGECDEGPALSSFADIRLGFKSLLNEFFYVDASTISRFGIEEEYVVPLLRLADLDRHSYKQSPSARWWLFRCNARPPDLRNTGAGRYVAWGRRQRTKPRKQTSHSVPWPKAPAIADRPYWYWPAAPVHKTEIALRKAVDDCYAPFIFNEAVLLDQRLYLAEPRVGISHELLAAYLSSSLFALSLETNADLGLGAGALTLGANNLRAMPCIDLASVAQSSHVTDILEAASCLMDSKPPTASDLAARDDVLRLDRAFLCAIGMDPQRSPEVWRAAVRLGRARLDKAAKRQSIRTAMEQADIGSVVDSVSDRLGQWLQMRRFPEDYYDGPNGEEVVITGTAGLRVGFEPLIGLCEVTILSSLGVEYQNTVGIATAEVLARGLQMGRRRLSLPPTEERAVQALGSLQPFMREFEAFFEECVSEIGLGDRHRETVRHGALERVQMRLDDLREPWDRRPIEL